MFFREFKIDEPYDGIFAYLQYLYTGKLIASPEVAIGRYL